MGRKREHLGVLASDPGKIERKFQGVKILPTYEESLRDYSPANQKPDKTILLDKTKNEKNNEE